MKPNERIERSMGFWLGTLAGLAATTLGYLAYRWLGWMFWPDMASQWVFAWVPGWIQAPMVAALGADAKVLGFYTGMVVQVLVGGLIGLAFSNRSGLGKGIGVTLAVAVTAGGFRLLEPAVQLPATGAYLLGALEAGVVYGLAYALLARWVPVQARGADPETSTHIPRWTRRRTLSALGAGAGTLLLWPWVRSDLRQAGEARLASQEPASPSLIESLRAGAPHWDELPDVPPWLTPEPAFYYVSKNVQPHRISLAQWEALELDGLVESPQRWTLSQLQELPQVEQYNTLQCIDFDPYSALTGDLIGNGRWTGVRLRTLLDRARIQPEAVDLKFKASDGYSDSLPVETVLGRDDVLLVWALNGEPLSAQHGYPLRLIIPGQYGFKNVKHVRRLTAVNEDYKGYWQQRGWVDHAPVHTFAKLESVEYNQAFPAGEPGVVAGWTYTGLGGISRVEVSTDDGSSWQEASVEAARAPGTWVRWAFLWEPDGPGRHALLARATDREGNPQVAKQTGAFPDGFTGYHRVLVDVIERQPEGSEETPA